MVLFPISMAASRVQYQGIRVARELQGSGPSPMFFNIYMKPLGMIVSRNKAGFRQLSVFFFLFSHGALVPVISSSLKQTVVLMNHKLGSSGFGCW